MRSLITFATLSACPILALALLVGCEERISPEKYAELNARIDTITAYQDTIGITIRGIMGLVPCPPCTVFAMPPGEWVTIPKLRREHYPWPDSVFIPRKE